MKRAPAAIAQTAAALVRPVDVTVMVSSPIQVPGGMPGHVADVRKRLGERTSSSDVTRLVICRRAVPGAGVDEPQLAGSFDGGSARIDLELAEDVLGVRAQRVWRH